MIQTDRGALIFFLLLKQEELKMNVRVQVPISHLSNLFFLLLQMSNFAHCNLN